jgi:hypothetical protein
METCPSATQMDQPEDEPGRPVTNRLSRGPTVLSVTSNVYFLLPDPSIALHVVKMADFYCRMLFDHLTP